MYWEKLRMEKTAPQIRFEDFWKEIEERVVIKISDITKLGELLADFVMRSNQLLKETRDSRDVLKSKYEKLLEEKKNASLTH